MSFPAGPPFNPQVSNVPVLGESSGNPKAYKDPNSTASLGKKLQAMNDQASADTLYDTPPAKVEGFRNEIYSPWILRTESCSKIEGFKLNTELASYEPSKSKMGILVLVFGGLVALIFLVSKKYKK
jgi:hypothetical protein